MNTIKPLLTTLCLLVVSSINVFAQSNNGYKVYIKQNGNTYNVEEHSNIKLSRSSFDIIIEMPSPTGMLVNASFNKSTYNTLGKTDDILSITCFAPGSGMADYKFNPENAIMAKESGSNYLFYNNDTEHRFNSVEKTDGSYICTRTVERIFNIDDDSEISINNIDQTLYLCFVCHKTGQKEILYQNKLAIKWRN